MNVPYVVSGDIRTLLGRWAKERGFTLPSDCYFEELRTRFSQEMRKLFPAFELIPEEEIGPGLQLLCAQRSLPIVTMECTYLETDHRLELARMADWVGHGKGLGSRNGIPPHKQAESLAAKGLTDVVLADDVIFTGSQIMAAIDLLATHRLRVVEVCAAIGIGNGTERLKQAKIPVRCVRTYAEVIDQVCERDFYPGVPFSGRVLAEDHRYAVHYVTSPENATAWATIPKAQALRFATFCTGHTAQLFDEVGRESGRVIRNHDLTRPFMGEWDNMPVSEILEEIWWDYGGMVH